MSGNCVGKLGRKTGTGGGGVDISVISESKGKSYVKNECKDTAMLAK